MVKIAEHILRSLAGHFQPAKFKDRYELALRSSSRRSRRGARLRPRSQNGTARAWRSSGALKVHEEPQEAEIGGLIALADPPGQLDINRALSRRFAALARSQ
jgi:hypothetical protein